MVHKHREATVKRMIGGVLVLFLVTLPALTGPGASAQEVASAERADSANVSTASDLISDPRVAEALHVLELWVDAQLAYERIPGISMGIVYDQDLIWSGGFGYSDLQKKTPATPQTIYSICSISKLFTSIGVMQLRDNGRLRLDDPVGQHLPWFTIEQAYPEGPEVTIEGILTHSSGLPRESDFPYWTGPDFPFPTHEEIVDRVSKQETLYPAFTYFQYSNLGLTLAGEIVAAASEPYDEYIRQNILEPLGMSDTSPEIPAELWGGKLATGYGGRTREGTRATMPLFQARGIAPAAGFASTVEDLAKFASWQIRLLDKGGDEILHANTLREMHRVHWLDPSWETTWGLGFSVWRADDKTFVGHGGGCPGYRSHLALRPSEKFAAIVMVNALVSPNLYTRRGYEIVAPAIAAVLESPDEAKQADPELLRYTGTYAGWWGGETAVFTWRGQLATMSLPTDNPMRAMTKLEHVDEHTFRRIRDDDELGEEIVFEVNDEGEVVRMWRHSNYSTKVR